MASSYHGTPIDFTNFCPKGIHICWNQPSESLPVVCLFPPMSTQASASAWVQYATFSPSHWPHCHVYMGPMQQCTCMPSAWHWAFCFTQLTSLNVNFIQEHMHKHIRCQHRIFDHISGHPMVQVKSPHKIHHHSACEKIMQNKNNKTRASNLTGLSALAFCFCFCFFFFTAYSLKVGFKSCLPFYH